MSLYRYRAYDQFGKVEKGYLPAETEQEVANFLARLNFIPVKIQRVREYFWEKILQKFSQRISLSQKIYLARNLHLILKSGLDLSQGLQILIEESKGGLKNFLLYFRYAIEKGEPFYRAFLAFPNVFSAVEVEMIKAGEIAGTLQKNLLRWAENLERVREVKREIISDLMYPILVLTLAFGVLVFLMLFVLPKITQLLEELVENPPLFTKIILSISHFFRANLTAIVYTILFFLLASLLFIISEKGKRFFRKIFSVLPLVKTLYLYLNLSDALFIIRSLVESGVHLTESFRLASKASAHPGLQAAFARIESYIKTGATVQEALRREKVIPSLLASILGVASESGAFVDVLNLMEEFYRTESRIRMKTLLNLLEPLIIIFLGVVVGFVAVSVIIPIYQQISKQLEFQKGRGGAGVF